jgi:hypothetical protein
VTSPPIPAEAIHAAAEVLCDWTCGTDPATCTQMPGHMQLAEGVLHKAEAVWPHTEPELLNGATPAEDTRDERWRDAQT